MKVIGAMYRLLGLLTGALGCDQIRTSALDMKKEASILNVYSIVWVEI